MPGEASDGFAALDAILDRAAGDPRGGWALEQATALSRDQAPDRRDDWLWSQWLLRVLALARGAPREVALVPGDDTPIRELGPPVAMVAGDGGPEPGSDFAVRWEAILGQAFAGLSGTVVSGGTTTGVPGVVGRAVKPACSGCRLVGYLPDGVTERGDARISDEYDEIRTTSGDRFGPLEPLATWRDVLASGTAPAQVRVLGIGGGRVSGFEYALAGVLGAGVGLVTGSGRAADEALAQGREWTVALSADAESVAAFLRTGG